MPPSAAAVRNSDDVVAQLWGLACTVGVCWEEQLLLLQCRGSGVGIGTTVLGLTWWPFLYCVHDSATGGAFKARPVDVWALGVTMYTFLHGNVVLTYSVSVLTCSAVVSNVIVA